MAVRIVAAAALALLLAGAAGASFPGANGELAYFYAGELHALSNDGAQSRELGAGLSPAWAPNGRRIAFDARTERNFDIWTMRADGSDRRRVTRDPAPDYFATWSPDATQIAFTSDRGGEDIYAIRADGTGERRLTIDPAPDWGPAWSPDGTRIAFAGNARGNLEVEVMSADGTGRVALTAHPERDYDPAWSPDGTRIAFTSERDGNANVYVMNADGTGLAALTTDPANDWRPAWSPDGTLIVFESDRDPAAFDRDVFVMNADGTEQRRLRTGNVNARDVDWQPATDLRVSLRRTSRTLVATVVNAGPTPAHRVQLIVRVPGRRRATRALGTLDAAATRTVRIAARRASVLASAWEIDVNPRDNATAFSG